MGKRRFVMFLVGMQLGAAVASTAVFGLALGALLSSFRPHTANTQTLAAQVSSQQFDAITRLAYLTQALTVTGLLTAVQIGLGLAAVVLLWIHFPTFWGRLLGALLISFAPLQYAATNLLADLAARTHFAPLSPEGSGQLAFLLIPTAFAFSLQAASFAAAVWHLNHYYLSSHPHPSVPISPVASLVNLGRAVNQASGMNPEMEAPPRKKINHTPGVLR